MSPHKQAEALLLQCKGLQQSVSVHSHKTPGVRSRQSVAGHLIMGGKVTTAYWFLLYGVIDGEEAL